MRQREHTNIITITEIQYNMMCRNNNGAVTKIGEAIVRFIRR